ncbi:MAG: hypothetical protein LC795_02730 [Acidobacteria bacterium]|nr:hypothetical protein [Acidobacteriota bacterium]
MKLHFAVPSGTRLARLAASAALLLSASAAVRARQHAPAPSARRNADIERMREQQQREAQLRRNPEGVEQPPDERAVKAAVKQLGEDFRRIQVIRNDVARVLVAGGALDYAHVSEQAVEVRKRALRMQGYLGLRDPGAEVVDVEGDARAGRDLREIISLSDAVREGAARLGRDGSTARHDGP